MAVLIQSRVGLDGWAELSFPFNRTLIDLIKSVPGSKWDKDKKLWRISEHGLAVLAPVIEKSGLGKVSEVSRATWPELPPLYLTGPKSLRPYQQTAFARMLTNAGFLLQFEMRVGKTPPTVAAIASALATGRAQRAFVLYPGGVRRTWERELKTWSGLTLSMLEDLSAIDKDAVDKYAATPWLVIGCHYEIAHAKKKGLLALADAGPFVIAADELHQVKNRKAPRTELLLELSKHPNCVHRWGLTGTVMRNRPRDMWAAFEFVQPGSMGGYWSYAKRYCDAVEGAYGWIDKGSSNEEELKTRLAAMSFRLTRADVAAYLPPSDRKVILCGMNAADAASYKALEGALGPQALRGLGDSDVSGTTADALRALSTHTMKSKIPVAIERVRYHLEDRGVKALVFANWHETLKACWDALEPEPDESGAPLPKPLGALPVFCAGGWMTPDKREKIRAQWAACPGPAVLLVNTLSSGVGIDLSDADCAIFLEPSWVPADFLQAEARIQDIHLGKRTSPPLYEYLFTKATIDEDMGLALVNKATTISAVVGGNDPELTGMASAFRDSGAVNRASLTLNKTDPEAVNAALTRLRERLMGKKRIGAEAQALAVEAADAFDDEDSDDEED